jgi:hypothetical protein
MQKIPLQLRKPVFENYLRYIFNADRKGPIQVTRNHDIGRYIISMIRFAEFPQAIEAKNQAIELILPNGSFDTHENKFIFLSKEDEYKINDYISCTFNLEFKQVMIIGKELGLQQKDIIYAFMVRKKLPPNEKNFDMLKKKDYRNKQKTVKLLFESLQSIGY